MADGQTFDITVNYNVTDGLASVANTATITIEGENDDPDAVDDSVATDADLAFNEDDGAQVITADILGNDTDPDTGDVLTVSAIDTTGTTGLVTLVGGVFPTTRMARLRAWRLANRPRIRSPTPSAMAIAVPTRQPSR